MKRIRKPKAKKEETVTEVMENLNEAEVAEVEEALQNAEEETPTGTNGRKF